MKTLANIGLAIPKSRVRVRMPKMRKGATLARLGRKVGDRI